MPLVTCGSEESQSLAAAIRDLQGYQDRADLPVAKRWLERASYHLTVRLETHLRGAPPATPEQLATAMVKSAGLELHTAADALLKAAEHFKNGKATPVQARQAYEAGQRARQAADGLVKR